MRFPKIANSLIVLNLIAVPPVLAEGDPLIFVDAFGGYQWGQNQDRAPRQDALFGRSLAARAKPIDPRDGRRQGAEVGRVQAS